MSDYLNLGDQFTNRYMMPIEDDGYLMIDTGYQGDMKKFLKLLGKHNISCSQIKYLVLTHMHADHVGFAKELLSLSGAELIYDVNDKMRLEAGKNNVNTYVANFFCKISSKISVAFPEKTQMFPAVFYDRYADAKTQPLSQYNIEFLFMKGHTECDLCLLKDGDLFCGDLCMNGILAHKHAPMWIYNKYDMLESWKAICDRSDITMIYPGHGKPFAASELKKNIEFWKDKGVLKLYSADRTSWLQ